MLITISMSAQIINCSELFFSEYVEGWAQNKAIEVYNPTNAAIDLSNYTIERYSNGDVTSLLGGITSLTGMLASGDVFVLTNGETDTSSTYGYCDPVLIALGDMAEPNGSYPTPLHMNGNDAMVLTKNGAIIDVIGKVSEDPAVQSTIPNIAGGWTDDASAGFTDANIVDVDEIWTMNHTLIRKSTVLYGDNNGMDLFNPSLEWDSLPVGTWSNLGAHTCDCLGTSSINDNKIDSYIIYPNPARRGMMVSVNANTVVKSVLLTNILGEQVRFNESINTKGLTKGTYIVDIEFSNGNFAKNKLIIE